MEQESEQKERRDFSKNSGGKKIEGERNLEERRVEERKMNRGDDNL